MNVPSNLGEVRPLLARLEEHEVTLPAEVTHAIAVLAALDDESLYVVRLPDVADIAPDRAAEALRRATLARMSEIELRNTSGHLRGACSDAIAGGLADHVDDVLDQLRPAFTKAARVISTAHAAGLRHDHDAADAIDLGPKAVELWQKLPAATRELDEIASVRLALASITRQPPAPDQQAGAFCEASGVWNRYRGQNRWLALVDYGLRLNTEDETRAACRMASRPPIAPSNPRIGQATRRGMLGTAVVR